MTGYCIAQSFDYANDGMDLVALFQDEPYLFFLDSSLSGDSAGRFSFLGFDPFEVVSSRGKNSLESLRARFNQFQSEVNDMPTPLCAGIVGFLSYDFGLALEGIPLTAADDLNLPDYCFGFYDCILTIDHLLGKLIVTSTGLPESDDTQRKHKAQERMDRIQKKISGGVSLNAFSKKKTKRDIPLVSSFSKEEYIDIIHQALEYIRQGEIYQVNLSQRFSFKPSDSDSAIDALDLHSLIRQLSPSHFSAYYDAGNFQIVSSSPEQFLNKQGKIIQTRPMKGTRRRGNNVWEDQNLEKELLESAKEKAELLMVTDLERNDLGRVCRYGSVKVKNLRVLEKYATVFQTTSTVEGILRDDRDCFDVLSACFPSGSVTGCPKIRAMQIIDQLEGLSRSLYTGSLGYIAFNGNMDFNILIRTVLVHNRGVYFHVGGGIVADSIPEKEYEETLIKAGALYKSLQQVFVKGDQESKISSIL